MNTETVQWIEKNADLILAFQERVVDGLERQAAAFLNLLLAGAGGALAYAVNLAEKQAAAWLLSGMAAVSAWLFLVAAGVLWRAVWSRAIYPPGNDPVNLAAAYDMDLVKAQVLQLKNSQLAITANRSRNDAVGRALNTCRLMAAATPLVFTMVALLAVWAD